MQKPRVPITAITAFVFREQNACYVITMYISFFVCVLEYNTRMRVYAINVYTL